MKNSINASTVVASVLAVIGVGVVGFLAYLWLAPFGHFLWIVLRYGWPFILLSLGAGLLFLIGSEYDSILSRVLGSLVVVAGIALMVVFPYMSKHAMWQASTNSSPIDSTAGELSFKPRSPYQVASTLAPNSMGDTNAKLVRDSHNDPLLTQMTNSDSYTYMTVRKGVGNFMGYNSVYTVSPPVFGAANNNSTRCDFSDEADLRIGGSFLGNSLGSKISQQTSPSVTWNSDDVFGTCQDGTPMVYVPLVQLHGFIAPYKVPAGVAIYNGNTGELKIEKNLDTDLPVYPITVASDQREASHASGSLWDMFTNAKGYNDTTSDNGNPNNPNAAEFSLMSNKNIGQNVKENGQYYVSPLTPQNSSSSVVAISTVAQNSVKSGQLNSLDIHNFSSGKSRQSVSTMANNITSSVLSGYKASGLKVFEVIPGENGNWVASIGKDQVVTYRANIAVDGTITLIDGDNSPSSQDNSTPNSQDSTQSSDSGYVGHIKLEKPIDQMTDQERAEAGSEALKIAQQIWDKEHPNG